MKAARVGVALDAVTSLFSFWLTSSFAFALPRRLAVLLRMDFRGCDPEFFNEADCSNCLLVHLLQTLVIGLFVRASSSVLEDCALQGRSLQLSVL